MGYLSSMRPEIKIWADGGHCSEVPSLLGNYISLHSKTEPAAINFYRDITKCLNCKCNGFFTLRKISNLEPLLKMYGLYSVLSRCWIEHEQERKELWWMDWMIFSSKLKLNLNIQQTREIFLNVKLNPLFSIF